MHDRCIIAFHSQVSLPLAKENNSDSYDEHLLGILNHVKVSLPVQNLLCMIFENAKKERLKIYLALLKEISKAKE